MNINIYSLQSFGICGIQFMYIYIYVSVYVSIHKFFQPTNVPVDINVQMCFISSNFQVSHLQ